MLVIYLSSFTVNQNHIGPAVSEILRYRQTVTQTDILLLLYKDNNTTKGVKTIVLITKENVLLKTGLRSSLMVSVLIPFSSPTHTDIIYMDIIRWETLLSNQVATIAIIYWPICSSRMSGGDQVKGDDEVYCYISQLEILFYQIGQKYGAVSN